MSWDEGLRPQQVDVAGSGRGHKVVLAGPGTGKTYVLVRRIEYLTTVHGVRAREVTALTFTRAAAAEMRDRLDRRLGANGARVRVSTLHSYALREILRAGARGLPSPLRVVGDWEERWVVVEELARVLQRRVLDIRNDRGTGALDLLADDWETLAADNSGWDDGYPDGEFLAAWRRHREVYGYTLRSELVYQLLLELRSSPDFSPGTGTAVLLVDEYQDLNRCDLDVVAMLSKRADCEVFATGDDDQSIYSFRHAHPSGIRNFTNEFSDAELLTMTECQRCGQDVVNLANWVINQESGRVPKELVSVTDWDAEVTFLRFQNQTQEAGDVARLIDNLIEGGTEPHDILVLLKADRNGRVSKALDEELAGRGHLVYLPRRGTDADTEMQRLVEYLLLADYLATYQHVDDLAVRSLMELEGTVGERRRQAVVEFCLESGLRFYPAIAYLVEHPDEYHSTNIRMVHAAAEVIVEQARTLRQDVEEPFEEWVDRVCNSLGLSTDTRAAVATLAKPISAEFEAEAGESHQVSFVQALLQSLTNLGDVLPPSVPGHITITTMHGAKGLSADTVIVLQAEDEMLPGDESEQARVDEARRLLYVSLTRAKKKLFVGACLQRTGGQAFSGSSQAEDRQLTRFLIDYPIEAKTVQQYLNQ